MSNLAVANVQKCLEILKKFYAVAKVDSDNEKLQAMAKEALDHLDEDILERIEVILDNDPLNND